MDDTGKQTAGSKAAGSKTAGSKAAVRAVLEFGDPPYMPLGVYAVDCDLASKILGRKTLVRDKVAQQIMLWEGRRDEVAQALAEDGPELYRKLDCIDVVPAQKVAPPLPPKGSYLPPAGDPRRVKKADDDTWKDGLGNVWKCAWETNDICQVAWAPVEYSHSADVDIAVPPVDETIFEAYDAVLAALSEDRFLLGHSSGFSPMALPGGMETGLMEYYLNPEALLALIAHHTRVEAVQDRFWLRPGMDAWFLEADMATTRGPLMNPAMFRSFCLPSFISRVESVKRYLPWVFFHSCGDNHALMDQYLQTGIDCYQSLQTGVMDLGPLISEYGDRMSFWGGVPVELLVAGSPAEVKGAVRKAYEDAARAREDLRKRGKRGGAFILGPSHSAAYGTTYGNFMAMLDEHVRLRDKAV
jgi:hypothetical protein